MACIISVSLYIFIRSIWPQMVLEHNQRSTRPRQLRELFFEMHHLEAGAVKRWSKKAESPPSSLRLTSRDIQMGCRRKSRSGLRSVGIGWEDIILPGVEDPMKLHGSTILRTERGRPKVGKIECVFSLYDRMRWKWDDAYLLRGLPNIYSMSLFISPLPLYLRTPRRRSLKMYLEAVNERVWRCTWRPWPCELAGHNRASLEIHFEAVIKRVRRPWSSQIGDTLRPRDRARLGMHWEAVTMRV